MKIDLAISEHAPGAARLASPWLRYGITWAAVAVAVILLFYPTAEHLFGIWWNNDTFGHCLLIPPIIAWLVWQRRDGLSRLAPQPWLSGAALILTGGILWLFGELAGIAVVQHAALVFMLLATVPTLFGLAVTRALTFPLLFGLFMIPVGEQLVPHLQTITAKFCIWLLDLFRVPAYVEGVFIEIPNGRFEVAEACSGIKFLIAMLAFGTLVANVCFKSWKRRIAFVAASISIPIVANGVRAWGTIYIAHLTTPEFARSVDHVVYGWFFFAFVLVLTLAVGWRFFDRAVDDPAIEPERLQSPLARPAPTRALATAAAASIVLAAAAPAYASFTASRSAAVATAGLALPTPEGWSRTSFASLPWEPQYKGATATAMSTYMDSAGQPVDLYIAVFDRQSKDGELIGYQQGVAPSATDGEAEWSWAGNRAAPKGGSAAQINWGSVARDVWQFYWVNGKIVGSPYAAKIEGLKARLLGGDPQAATVVISAQRSDPMVSAVPAIERFARAMGPVDKLIAESIIPARGN